MTARELDLQLQPAPAFGERLKAITLLKYRQLENDQRTQLALKRAGTQTFQEIADELRELDRTQAFLQQSTGATLIVKKAFPMGLGVPEETEPEIPT